jgi:hypothetical protein
MAAVPSFENNCYFCTLVARREVCESRHLAKPPDVIRHVGTARTFLEQIFKKYSKK